jgi:hypothetical protein
VDPLKVWKRNDKVTYINLEMRTYFMSLRREHFTPIHCVTAFLCLRIVAFAFYAIHVDDFIAS